MASREGDGKHRAAGEPDPPRGHRRDVLDPHAAMGAVWFTRWACTLTNVVYGAGFIAGGPTGSSTYQAMETLMPMWAWGSLLVAFGPLLLLGRIALAAPFAAAVWCCFVGFNLGSTAWGAPVFALPASLHMGMWWFVLRAHQARSAARRDDHCGENRDDLAARRAGR